MRRTNDCLMSKMGLADGWKVYKLMDEKMD